jgi:hypothetical protein
MRLSGRPSINTGVNFPAYVYAESAPNISHNPWDVISIFSRFKQGPSMRSSKLNLILSQMKTRSFKMAGKGSLKS